MAHNVGEDAMNWPSFMYVLPSRSNSFRSTTCAKQVYLDDSTLNQVAYPMVTAANRIPHRPARRVLETNISILH